MGNVRRGHAGGIGYLIRLDRETDGAIEYDLMTLLGIRLRDVPGTIGWDGLKIFCRHLPDESATMRAVYEHDHDGMEHWGTRGQTNELLADIYDLVNRRFVSQKDKYKVRPLERPWDRKTRHFGKGGDAMSKDEFLAWYYGGD